MLSQRAYSIPPVKEIAPLAQRLSRLLSDSGGKNKKKHTQYRAGKFLKPLSRAARASNLILHKKNIPFRFCVFVENGEMVFDLVELDSFGKIIRETRTNITDDSFEHWIYNIDLIEGLLFDQVV